jgi:hypothetical protein
MKALSIRQPWAWLIVNGHKDIENRTWPSYRRGPILIHASKGMTKAEYEDVLDMLAWQPGIYEHKIVLPAFDALERGGIVGRATIADSLTASTSPWFFGPHGFLLRDVTKLPFIEFKGALGFFDVPDDLIFDRAAAQKAGDL